MIKYVELTAPDSSKYRQAKIISIEKNEGDNIKVGETLFKVKAGEKVLDLPSTREGRIVEFIVTEQENISLSTPLILLETEVSGSTASKPIADSSEFDDKAPISEPKASEVKTKPNKKKRSRKKATKKASETIAKRLEQQSLNLLAGLESDTGGAPATTEKQSESKAPLESPSEKIEMSKQSTINVSVPDIGADSAKVIEVLVKVGDQVSAEDPLVTLESDKASMDVPSPTSGKVSSISVLIDQDVSEGTLLLELETDSRDAGEPVSSESKVEAKPETAPQTAGELSQVSVSIPDIGGDSAKVVEVLVSVGDAIEVEDPLVTLESDKASMEVPSSHAGTVTAIMVNVDDDVSEGTIVVELETASSESAPEASTEPSTEVAKQAPASSQSSAPAAPSAPASNVAANTTPAPISAGGDSHASPSIRRFARELGVDLSRVTGSGRKNRITKDDIKAFVKGVISNPVVAQPTASGSGIPTIPDQDFSKFGEIEVQPLNKIKRLTATNLHRSWVNVPHVTHNDESDISNLEEFRKQLNAEYKAQKKDVKLSPLAFIVKAVVSALQTYPQFNSSIESSGENLILKKYFHVGIAVDTPNGLVVPVIRDADKKSVAEIAVEMGELAKKARDKKLTMNDMSGACFTISSLGGIGGTGFTPIVNAPEVAILGVSRTKIAPVWNGSEFVPGQMLPLSLSYDHRVIDGAEAARFTRHIAAVLEDIRRLTV